MKKLLCLILMLFTLIPVAFADDAANIRIRISGANSDNRYFLCMPNLGCLSILAGEHGKVYPVYNDIDMHPLYVSNMQNFSVYAEGLPPSCNVHVSTGQTLSIFGRLIANGKGDVYVANLSCSVN